MLRVVNGVVFLLPFGDDTFWGHVDFSGPTMEDRPELGPCWLWTGGLKGGYGYYRMPTTRRNAFAHRYLWIQTYGPLRRDQLVCHHCDTPACVNPLHLWLGTDMLNTIDKRLKGRHVDPVVLRGDAHRFRTNPEVVPRGEQHWNARLTPDDVRFIRGHVGEFSQADLARRFGVPPSAISKIVTRRSWKHIE
jgi:hypothetical protein